MKQGILLFLLTPRWPARYSLFLLFSLLPLFSKKGAKKTGIRSCQSARALLTSRKRHSSVARALSFAAGRKHCGAAQLAALKHITACFLVLLGGSLCHLRLPQYLILPLLRLRAVLQRVQQAYSSTTEHCTISSVTA